MPGEAASPTQPFPTVLPPYGRQRFTVDDLDPTTCTDEQRAQFKQRLLADRNDGLFTPAGFTETVEMPGNNGGSIFFTTAADPANGMVYVICKNVPSLIKLVDNPRVNSPPPVGSGRGARGGRGRSGGRPGRRFRRPRRRRRRAQQGRAIYEQNCQICHGNDLKGSGSSIRLDDIVARIGETARSRDRRPTGRAICPRSALCPRRAMTALMVFLGNPAAAPPGSAAAIATASVNEIPYPEGVEHPPVRYYTGYGYETLAINPPWSTLTAYDLNKGTIKWQVPYGDNPAAGPNLGKENARRTVA